MKGVLRGWRWTRRGPGRVLSAVTEPSAVRATGRSPARARAMTTGVARGPGAADAPPEVLPPWPLPGRVSAYAPPARTQPTMTTAIHVRVAGRIRTKAYRRRLHKSQRSTRERRAEIARNGPKSGHSGAVRVVNVST